MFDYNLEHLFTYTVTLDQPEVIGPIPEGIRVNLHLTGRELTGPKVHGKVRPVGADFLTIRTDGVGILDVRATIETQEEALISSSYMGVGDLGEDGYDKFLQGVPPLSSRSTRGPTFSNCPPPLSVAQPTAVPSCRRVRRAKLEGGL